MDVSSSFNLSLSGVCTNFEINRITFLTLLIFYPLLTPLFGYVLYVGCTEWKKQRKGGHSDGLTFNMIAMESINVLGVYFLYLALFHGLRTVHKAGDFLYMLSSTIQASFHSLICLERYMAVVHPVAYLRLKNRSGIVVRNVSVVLVWLFSCGCVSVGIFLSDWFRLILGLLLTVSHLILVSFCCVSVLRVLIRPAPGDRKHVVDQTKRAAFDTIMIILGALVLRFLAILIFYVEGISNSKSVDVCMKSVVLTLWLKIPSSLVLPLLFLQRAGKLPGVRPKISYNQ